MPDRRKLFTTVSAPDERDGRRYSLVWPLTLAGGIHGQVHDLSESGLLYETSAKPEVGTQVRLEIDMDEGMPLVCQGEVVRVDEAGDSFNVAVKLDKPLLA